MPWWFFFGILKYIGFRFEMADFSKHNPGNVRPGWERISSVPCLKLVLAKDWVPSRNFKVEFQIEKSPLEFLFPALGNGRCTLCHTRSRKTVLELRSNQNNVSFYPMSQGTLEYAPSSPVSFVSVHLEPMFFERFREQDPDNFPEAFKNIVEGSQKDFVFIPGKISGAMQMIVHQMLHCPYKGSVRQIFLESKSLELVALKLAQMQESPDVAGEPLLRPGDVERIHEVKRILLENIEDPPSLLNLAHRAGLNEFKLKKGFRKVFGTTVFGYLRQHRMKKARLLLEDGCMNVTEVANAVGYNNPSYFSNAFRKQFGTLPSVFRADRKHQISMKTV